MRHFCLLTFFLLSVSVGATDFSRLVAEKVDVEDFARNSKEGHVMPPPAFFVQQLKNMCHQFEHEALSYYICSHL